MLKFIEEVGMEYATPNSKTKRKMAIYECSGCGKKDKRPISVIKMGYTNWCVECGIKARKKQHNKEWHGKT